MKDDGDFFGDLVMDCVGHYSAVSLRSGSIYVNFDDLFY